MMDDMTDFSATLDHLRRKHGGWLYEAAVKGVPDEVHRQAHLADLRLKTDTWWQRHEGESR